jgi:uncharacterized NAD-dependent epimerase/dehydratase family protein
MSQKGVKDAAGGDACASIPAKQVESTVQQQARPDGTAVVYCEGMFGATEGKTAHGLVRHTERYRLLAVIDGALAGRDAGEVLDGTSIGVPIVADLRKAERLGGRPDYLVIGVATHGGVLPDSARPIIREALENGISVDSGLHQLLGDDPEFAALSRSTGARIRDVRRTPTPSEMHSFTGEIQAVTSVRIAVLGTDCGVGKRTTAVGLVKGLRDAGHSAALIGTGQTSWMQGARYGLIMDCLVNDFVSGEIEHQVCRAFREERPDVIVIEGQGCLTNPAYPGGFEILAAARPDAVVLQHAPARSHYDGFPGFPLAGIDREMAIIDLLSRRPVIALTLNHEGMSEAEVHREAAALSKRHGIPCCDPLLGGVGVIVEEIRRRFPRLSR